MTHNAVKLGSRDNVASALAPLSKGQKALVAYREEALQEVTLLEDVPFAFKLAVTDIARGEAILKYGEAIGVATRDIRAGQMVHVHNIDGARAK